MRQNAINLLAIMARHGVNNLIFSSTAAVYGNPRNVPITEDERLQPINPEGRAKAFLEKVLEDLSVSNEFRSVSLRYFNPAGPRGKDRGKT